MASLIGGHRYKGVLLLCFLRLDARHIPVDVYPWRDPLESGVLLAHIGCVRERVLVLLHHAIRKVSVIL